MDAAESVEATITRKVQQIKSEFVSSKQNIAKADVDCFIQELTGYSEVLKITSKTEECSEQSNILLRDVTDLLQNLSLFNCDLKENREVLSKIIDMETNILKYKAVWDKLSLADQVSQESEIRRSISGIMKEIEVMQTGSQYNKRLNKVSQKCFQVLHEIELTISKIENFNAQFFALQEQHQAIFQSVKSSNDIEKALLNLEEIKLRAENLLEFSDESRDIKHDFITSINRDIEQMNNILENDKKKLINLLEDFSGIWHQIQYDLNTKPFNADFLNKAETILNETRNSIDTSIKVLKEKTGHFYVEEQEINDEFQRKFKDIKNQVHAANIEDDQYGSQFLHFANDLRKLHAQITDHQSFLKEVKNYADALEKEADNLSYLFGMEAKANEIDDLFRKGVNIAEIQIEVGRFQSMLEQNSFKTSLGRSEKRWSNLVERVESQVFRLKQLKIKARQDHINAEEIVLDVEKTIKNLEPSVRTFVGTKNGNHFFQLSELITRHILQLDGIKTQNDEIQIKKVNLLKTLHELGDELECRCAAAELLDKLDTRIKDTLIFIKHIDRLTEEEQFKQVETTFLDLQNERESVPEFDELKEKIAECDQNLNLLERLILIERGREQELRLG